jgi:hypothetical protein
VIGVLEGFGGLVGIGGDGETPDAGEPRSIEFVPGTLEFAAGAEATIDEMARRMRDQGALRLVIEHELGRADLDLLRERANPSAQACLDLSERYRARRDDRLRERSRVAAVARAAIATGRTEGWETTRSELRRLDYEIAAIERALDDTLSLLSSSAELREERRTHAAAEDLGARRLATLRAAVLEAGIKDVERRIRLRPYRYREPQREGGGSVSLTPVLPATR